VVDKPLAGVVERVPSVHLARTGLQDAGDLDKCCLRRQLKRFSTPYFYFESDGQASVFRFVICRPATPNRLLERIKNQ
jgi:hypothetical protein